MWRAMCPHVGDGASSTGAAKAHGEGREGDEEGRDEQQRHTKQRNAKGGPPGGRRQRRKTMGSRARTAQPLARLVGEENRGGAGSRRTAMMMRSY